MPQLTKSLSLDTSGELENENALLAVAGGRTVRGQWLTAAAGPLASGDYEDWVLCDSSATYLQGSQIEFTALTSSNYEETRWRHGFDGEYSRFEFFEASDGYKATGWVAGETNGTMTISNVIAPMYCWDVAHDSSTSTERVADAVGAAVELWWCEEKDETGFQDWEWVSTSNGALLRNARTQLCAGVAEDVDEGTGLVLYDCATIAGASSYGSLEFDARWLEETVVTPRHGIFHYDRDQGPDGYDPDGVTWDNTTTDAWNKIGMIPYDVTNISTMSLLLAGNSTVEFTTSMCGPEGCPYTLPVCRTCGTRMFKWTTGDSDLDAINWNVTDDPSVDVPSQSRSGATHGGFAEFGERTASLTGTGRARSGTTGPSSSTARRPS